MASEIDTAMSNWSISNTVTPPSSGGGIMRHPGMCGGLVA
jgi:hypothetical protein